MAGNAVIGEYPVDNKGKLPVGELASDRPGASSPFGDDLSFPLPAEVLTYAHPVVAAPEHEQAGH